MGEGKRIFEAPKGLSALPARSGWLKKMSPHPLKGWQQRWFVLHEGQLLYWKSISGTSGAQGGIQVREIASISAMIGEFEETAPDNATEIRIEAPHPKTGARREFRLKAQTREEALAWLFDIKDSHPDPVGFQAPPAMLAAGIHTYRWSAMFHGAGA